MAERSVMAQIFVFGRVMNDLVPKESQSKQSYVCFDLMERTKNWTQFYLLDDYYRIMNHLTE